MGWWASEDGTGVIGDRPADILGTALNDALGDRFDVDLLTGFLVAVGGALLRNPSELVSDGLEPDTSIVVDFADTPAVFVPITRPGMTGGLDDALYDALEATMTEVKVRRDPDCPICSRPPDAITDEEMGVFPDYEAFCAAAG